MKHELPGCRVVIRICLLVYRCLQSTFTFPAARPNSQSLSKSYLALRSAAFSLSLAHTHTLTVRLSESRMFVRRNAAKFRNHLVFTSVPRVFVCLVLGVVYHVHSTVLSAAPSAPSLVRSLHVQL